MSKTTLTYDLAPLLKENASVESPLNGHMHDIELYITNGTGKYIIAPTAIVSLVLEESLSTWGTQGSLTVFYSNELAEYLNQFIFRNDGEDLLRIRIMPRDFGGDERNLKKFKPTKKMWELNHIFSIYNVEDVTPQDTSNSLSETLKKFKKFYFWDIRYQTLLTRNIEYSTTNSDLAQFNKVSDEVEKYRDEYRAIPTDAIIDEIIKTAFEKDPILSKTAKDTSDINDNWDSGSVNVFYTSPADSTALEDLSIAHSFHVGSKTIGDSSINKDYSLLTIEREENGIGYFALKPFSRFFEKAGSSSPGPYQIEHFFLQSDTKPSTTNRGYWRSPIALNQNNDRDLTFRDYSTIIKYEFVDIASITNTTRHISTPVYSFDYRERVFNVEFENHSVKSAQTAFLEYMSNLYQDKNSNNNINSLLIKNTNSGKLANYSVMPTFSVRGDTNTPEIRNSSGFHELLYSGLFQNTCINFTVPGLTFRVPGKFIAIDRVEGSIDNSFDDKLCGQWFVINVIHTIANQAYYNNITAVKIHSYKPLNFFDNINNASLTPPKIGLDSDTPIKLNQPQTPQQVPAPNFNPFTPL